MNRQNYLLKNIGLLSISNFSSKILVFLLVPLYTSVLTTAEYGLYDFAISTVSLLFPIFTLNIVDGVMRFLMDRDYSKEQIATIGIKYVSFSVIMFVVFMLTIRNIGIWQGVELLVFLYYLAYVFNQFFIQFAKGMEMVSDMAIAGVIGTITMLVLNLLFLKVFRFGLYGFFVANIISQAIPAVYYFFRLRFWDFIKDWNIDKILRHAMLTYSIPLLATTLGWWINNTLDKYAVTFICGVAANGLLSVSYKIPQILNTFQSIFGQAWQISAIKEYGEHDSANFYGKIFSTINVLMCAVCAWLILLTKPIANILYAKDFYQAWIYVPFLLISSVINCASGLLGPILSAKRNTKVMMWSAIIGAIFNAVLNILLIRLIGIQGATIATVISSLVIYLVRRIGVAREILISDRYWITWILLVIEGVIEITIGNVLLELTIVLIMLFMNIRLFNGIFGYFSKRN